MRSHDGRTSSVLIACAALAGCNAVTPPARTNATPEAGVTPDAGDPDAFPATDSGHRYDKAILSFVAARAYHDLPSLDVKDDSKFEVFLLPSIHPSEVDGIRVFGPDGFTFDFMNVPFETTANGYLQNEREPTLWYQALRASTLDDGRYTARVTFTNGERQEYSRELVSGGTLLDFYLAHRQEMHFQPDGGASPAASTVLTWSTFHDLGGPDAYYNAWISPGTTESVSPDGLRGDNVLISGFVDPSAGLNVGASEQGTAADPLPLGPVTWQVEILDSNELDGINQIIFPAGRHFMAE